MLLGARTYVAPIRLEAQARCASYLAEAVQPFVKGEGGRLRLTCAMDRHGQYRRGQVVGELVMSSSGQERLRLRLYEPTVAISDVPEVPTILAARAAIDAAKTAGSEVTRNALEGLMKVKTSAAIKRGGIDHAGSVGALSERDGANRSRLYGYVHELAEAE